MSRLRRVIITHLYWLWYGYRGDYMIVRLGEFIGGKPGSQHSKIFWIVFTAILTISTVAYGIKELW